MPKELDEKEKEEINAILDVARKELLELLEGLSEKEKEEALNEFVTAALDEKDDVLSKAVKLIVAKIKNDS